MATPWLVVSFGAGRASGTRWSAVAGSATVLTGLAGYYLWLLLGQGAELGILTGSDYRGSTWMLAGAVVGAVAGAVGGLSRHPRALPAAAAWCGITAVPCADAIVELAYGGPPPSGVVAVVGVFGATALALLVWARRSGARLGMLAVGVPVTTLVLWQLELAVLQQVFGRLTWI